jgi:ABC-type uncharacterized transport system fused permease/ATPase subunit
MTQSNRHWSFFLVQLVLYGGMLFIDLSLVAWYDSFYSAIQAKSHAAFIRELIVFVLLTLSQAVALGLIAFNSELYEAQLKKHFVARWLRTSNFELKAIRQEKVDQRVIDDANLSAEKVAVILPALIFNIVKAAAFLILLTQYPTNLVSDAIGWKGLDKFVLSIFGIAYLVIQYQVLKRANSWVFKSENIKRSIEARTRYKLLSEDMESKSMLAQECKRYVQSVVKIRVLVGKAHGINVVAINGISSLSFIVPFLAIFSAYETGLITFGELMKISATYSGFQMSALYVFNSYKEALIGLAALNRLKMMRR